jgi:two-component system phosphate regulon sensor histidine kinase PhoR
VKRGLFLSFFIRIAIALAFVVAMRIWFNPRGWALDVVLLIG